ncbi:MAG TPA: phage holin family protein [Verrucomicrobiae bacterium]
MDEAPPKEGGVLSSVTRVFRTLRDTAENRLELFLTELKEERIRLFDALALLAIAIIGALMALVTLTLTVVVVFWDSHRLLALVLVTVAYTVTALAAFLNLRSRLQRWQAFSATLGEIKKDAACFKKPN